MGMRMKAEMEPWKLGTLSLRDAPSYLSGVAQDTRGGMFRKKENGNLEGKERKT